MGLFGNKKEEVTTKKQVKEEPEESEEESDNTYEYDHTCDNCGDEESYDIPKGTTTDEYFLGKKCEVCGCDLIQR